MQIRPNAFTIGLIIHPSIALFCVYTEFGIDSSLRMSEVRGLQFRDLKDNTLTVCRSNIYFDGKNNVRDQNKTYKSTRKLTIPDYIKNLIMAVPHEKEDEFIVQMEYQTLRSKFYKLLEEHNYHMTFHDLRHIYTMFSHLSNSSKKSHYPPCILKAPLDFSNGAFLVF